MYIHSMKKSTIYFTGGAISFLLSCTWSFLVFWNLSKALHIPLLSFPFTGFAFIFAGIFLAKKGMQLNNVENGRLATDPPVYTKKTGHIITYSMIVLFTLIATVLIIKWVSN